MFMKKYRFYEHILINKVNKNSYEFYKPIFALEKTSEKIPYRYKKILIEIDNKNEDKLIEQLIDFNPKTIDQLSKRTNLEMNRIKKAIQLLIEKDLIEVVDKRTILSEKEIERYDRQLKLFGSLGQPYKIQEILKRSKISVIGLGSIGSWLCYNLASMGVGEIIGFDPDIVELSNLNRQILYSENDIGTPKALIAQKKLRKLNSDISIKMFQQKIDEQNIKTFIPNDLDIIISTVVPLEYALNSFCVKNRIPLISQGGGMFCPTGVIVMRPFQTGCFNCIKDPRPIMRKTSQLIYNRFGKQYSTTIAFSPFFSLCASIMSMEVFKLLTGYGEPVTNIIIEPFTWQIFYNIFPLKRRANCEICGNS